MPRIIRSVLPVLVCATLSSAQTASPPSSQSADDGVVLVGAGDIANCDMLGGARATAALLDAIPGTVFTTGDHAYQTGSAKDFANCYEPTWGRHKKRTRPAIGNHDLVTDKGRAYFEYFGENAGPPGAHPPSAGRDPRGRGDRDQHGRRSGARARSLPGRGSPRRAPAGPGRPAGRARVPLGRRHGRRTPVLGARCPRAPLAGADRRPHRRAIGGKS